MKNTLIVVLGPTGIGKSDISIDIAKYFNTDIISADSRQIFKELNIGTAVPPKTDLSKIKHHFIQTISISEYYNASKFEMDVLQKLEELFPAKNPVVMTGGSMMYIDAVCKGIDDLPNIDDKIRKHLLDLYNSDGIESIRLQLKKFDPTYYNQVDLKNHKRLLHALEICLMTGKPYSSFRTNTIKKRPFDILKIGLNMPREELYDRINTRVLKMIETGLEEEARKVYKLKHLNSLNTVGYKELFMYFDGKCTLEESIDLIQRNSRKYARKQLTWFRKDQEINWFEPTQLDDILHFLQNKLNNGQTTSSQV